MPVKRVKDRTHLLDEFKLYSSRKPHYVSVYVWATHAAMYANTDLSDVKHEQSGDDGITAACHLPAPYGWNLDADKPAPDPKLAELHFVVHHWNEEIVAHELQHAIIHRMRVLPPLPEQLFDVVDIADEEEICYEFGRWFRRLRIRIHELWDAWREAHPEH